MCRKDMQHICNPLHLYCRLIDIGVPPRLAKKIGCVYEKLCFVVIRKLTFQKVEVKECGEVDVSVDLTW